MMEQSPLFSNWTAEIHFFRFPSCFSQDPAKALGQNLVDGATDLQAVLDDAVAGITQPVAE